MKVGPTDKEGYSVAAGMSTGLPADNHNLDLLTTVPFPGKADTMSMEYYRSERRTALGALFMDFDDIYGELVEEEGIGPEEAASHAVHMMGRVNTFFQERMGVVPIIRMAFADWSLYPDVLNELYTMGIKPVHAKAGQAGETADIELSLALQETMLTRNDIGVMAVLAGDRDYMPVIHRAIDRGKRVVFFSFADTLSGDIRRLLGDENCVFLDQDTGEVLEPGLEEVQEGADAPKKDTADTGGVEDVEEDGAVETPTEISKEKGSVTGPRTGKVGPGPATRATPPPPVKKEEVHWLGLTEKQLKGLRAAIRAIKDLDPRHQGMKVSKFLVMDLAKALPDIEHLERKGVFNSLVQKGVIEVITKTSALGEIFSIFVVPRDNPVVREVVETLGD